MKEKNTNEKTSKRDQWSKVQTDLGLLSSPVEHEQISVVNAVDPQDQDDAPLDSEAFENDSNHEISSPQHETEAVVVNIDLPTPTDSESDSDDLFGFDYFGDSGIPKNAFASPKKARTSHKIEKVAEVRGEETPHFVSPESDFASETKLSEIKNVSDPLMSDELPTSLWKPRKPQAVSKTKSDAPALSGDTSRHSPADALERKSESRSQGASPGPVDDLARHSSGKKRQERSNSRYEKFDDRRPKESSHRSRDDDFRCESEPPIYRRRKEAAPQTPLDAPAFEDDLPWEPKPQFRGKNRKSDKSSFAEEDTSFAFAEGVAERDKQAGFAADLDREMEYEKDWLSDDAKTKHSAVRNSRRDRKRNAVVEPTKSVPEKDTQNSVVKKTFDKEEGYDRYSHKERKPSPPPTSRPPEQRPQRRGETPAAESPSQKITVAGWDDAVRDIIEKNMQRRPAGKTERQSGGRRGPRR